MGTPRYDEIRQTNQSNRADWGNRVEWYGWGAAATGLGNGDVCLTGMGAISLRHLLREWERAHVAGT